MGAGTVQEHDARRVVARDGGHVNSRAGFASGSGVDSGSGSSGVGDARLPVIAVTGMAFEARIARGPGVESVFAARSDLLERAIGELPERERRVLALYHFEELTMKEVGSVIGIGESRVSQIHTEALVRLRARMHEVMAMHPAAATAASSRGRR